jgi:cold shock CspA family protein
MGTVIWFDPKAGYGFIKPDERRLFETEGGR